MAGSEEEMSEESALFGDPDLAQFYDSSDVSRPDFDFCIDLAKDGDRVLDLGCGTGDLALRLSKKCRVTAIDPAEAMLAIARRKPHADRITWRQADARSLRLEDRFDLVCLTGHSFQCFLDAGRQLEVLRTIASHLAPEGRFVFDSRNPACPVRKERRLGEVSREYDHKQHGKIVALNQSRYDEATGILSYENIYRVVATGAQHSAGAQIKYTPLNELKNLIASAGLSVVSWYGDWRGADLKPNSREIIPLGRLAAKPEATDTRANQR